MIVSLAQVKRLLGIQQDDTSQDENLTTLIQSKTEWVQNQTHRRFDTPTLVTEYHEGRGLRMMFLNGHVDDSPEADNASESQDPSTSVKVWRRPILEAVRDWELLTEGSDWERRDDALIFLQMWRNWPVEDEFKIEYMDGYAVAPADVQELVLELVMNKYLLDEQAAGGTAGITSESLGDFSYARRAGSTELLTLSPQGQRTLADRTRKFT